ncbi:hypothetical protein ACWGJX_01385 [Streptomyces sp. NPDC054775]
MREDIEDQAAAALRPTRTPPLRSALRGTDADDWLALDVRVREESWHSSVTQAQERAAAPLLPDLTRLGLAEPAFALCHHNGRVRERAVGQAWSYPGLLPLIVIRCADWVEPVRERARDLLHEALDTDTAPDLAPLILRIGGRGRGAFGVGLLEEVLRRAPDTGLAALLTSPDRSVRRFAHRLAIELQRLCPAELARTAARDKDTVVQDLCSDAALTALQDAETYDDVLGLLLNARSPRARSAGVTALRRAGRPELAVPFLADRSALVRACARYVIRQHGGDPTLWYRDRCAAPDDPGLPPGAVIGLAESGGRPDSGLLWPLLAHPAAGVRSRAVAGLRILDLVDAERMRPLLDDPAPRVVRETTLALQPSSREVPLEWLLERIGRGRPRHVRLAAFRLLDARGGEAALRAAAELLADGDTKLRTWAAQCVRRRRLSVEPPRRPRGAGVAGPWPASVQPARSSGSP